MSNVYAMTGTLTDGKTLILDETLPVSDSKVRVTVEIVGAVAVPKVPLQEWLEELHKRRAAEGRKPLTAAEIEEWVQDIRYGRGH